MLFSQIDEGKRHNKNIRWFLARDNEEITAVWSENDSAYKCNVTVTKYNDQWEEIGYKFTTALLTDADLNRAEVLGNE